MDTLQSAAAFNEEMQLPWRPAPRYQFELPEAAPSLSDAEAELELLENGRATMKHQFNMTPPKHLKSKRPNLHVLPGRPNHARERERN